MINYLNSVIPYFQHPPEGQTTTHRPSLESRLLEPSKVIEFIATINSIPGVIFYNSTKPATNTTPAANPTLPSDFEVVRFTWSRSSLGWYESILWGCIFQGERQVTLADTGNVMNSSSNPVGVWNGTNIKLFKFQETAPRGPSLLRPKGAVDAMAETVIQKIGQLRTSNK